MTDNIKHYTQSLNYELEQTARLMRMVGLQLFKTINIDITPDDYSTLDTISINNGICQRDLAKLILKDRANTGKILNGLDKKGFITRSIDTKNNRPVKKIYITDAGRDKLKEISSKIISYFKAITVKISKEKIKIAHEALKELREELGRFVTINI